MRCFFLRNGHVVAVELLAGLSYEDAIARAHLLFSGRSEQFEGFEIWEGVRMLFRYPDPNGAL